jgi:ubiquitin fusion degradation protein 1
MFNRLYLEEGMMVNLRNIRLEKGKFIKIKPHLTEFVMNPNPRTILENALRNYMCLTKGDTICVMFNKKKYMIDIVECKPKDSISLTNVDVEVDFDTPADYKEENDVFFLNLTINRKNLLNKIHL